MLRRGVLVLRRLPAVAVCALAAHALIYQTLSPSDGVHGYFSWYEPALGAASLASLLGLLCLLAAASAARRRGRPLRRPRQEAQRPVDVVIRALGAASLVFLLAQESLERTLATGHPTVALFTPSQWLVLLVGIASSSTGLALALRVGQVVVRRAFGEHAGPRRRLRTAAGWSIVTSSWRRPRALAGCFALRAPPLALS